MSDSMRFTPDRIAVKQGETVRFVLGNGGKVLHKLVLGTKKELDEHAALMLKFPDMEHDEPYPCVAGQDRRDRVDLQPPRRRVRLRLPDPRTL